MIKNKRRFLKNLKYFSAEIVGTVSAYTLSVIIAMYTANLETSNAWRTFLNLGFNALGFIGGYLITYHSMHLKEYYYRLQSPLHDISVLMGGFAKGMSINYSLKAIGYYSALSLFNLPHWLLPFIIYIPAELIGYTVRQIHNHKYGYFEIPPVKWEKKKK